MPASEERQTSPVPAVHPASYAQEQLFFLDELASGNAVYNILMVWRLSGPLRIDALEDALELVVSRHQALRTTIHRTDEGIHQAVAPPEPFTLPVIDLSDLPAADREKKLDAEIDTLNARPYDLGQGPLHRFALFRLGPDEHVFCQGYHHIVTDGWSTGLINAEISAAYRDLCAGTAPSLADVSLDYTDFARAQRERLDGAGLKEDLDFWKAKLDGVPVLQLPADRPGTVGGSGRGATLHRTLSPDVRELVARLGDGGASPFMVLAAALNVVLSRATGQGDIPIGVPMLGRPQPQLESVVGMFVNMAVLRCDLSDDPSFRDVVDRVMDGTFELYDHQEAPFNQVVDAVRPVREPGRNPLFQVSFQVLGGSTSGENLNLEGVTSRLLPQAAEGARFDLAITLVDDGQALDASVEFSTDLFDTWRPEALLTQLETVLRAAAENPDRPVSTIPLADEGEQDLLLEAGHGGEAGAGSGSVPQAVARTARDRPGTAAVISGGTSLTYAELDRRSGVLAAELGAAGVRQGGHVVLVSDRWDHTAVAAMAVWRAGGVLTHLCVAEAVERLAFVAVETGATVVLTDDRARPRLPEPSGWALISVDAPEAGEPLPDHLPTARHEPEIRSPALVRHAHGGAGAPAGLSLPHSALSFDAESRRLLLRLDADSRLFLPPIATGPRHGDLWAALTCGATVVAVAPEDAGDAAAVTTALLEHHVTHAHLPPALRGALDPTALSDLVCVRGSDHEVRTAVSGAWAQGGRHFVTLLDLPGAPVAGARTGDGDLVPYRNRSLYVVDDALNPVPRGVEGRLLVGGAPGTLADGALGLPEGGSAQTGADPFRPGQAAFLTDERARWDHELRLELLGGPGDRIASGGVVLPAARVEALLSGHPDVSAALVVQNGTGAVTACIRPADGRTAEPGGLADHLGAHLSEQLIPGRWVMVPELPVHADWETDREALRDTAAADPTGPDGISALTPTEESVAEVFREVLDVAELGADESFFSAGGNSLQAMRAISRVNAAFGIKLSVRVMYGNVTVRAIAELVDGKLQEARS
ncbi:condensation domain-containing protein [Streptomyces cyaneofuscatus]|uniref:condensation domain-containing protein n=1 Tax=Streptomyces cyaneofuscatus TaxID=66883 RepID=UPI0037CDBC45